MAYEVLRTPQVAKALRRMTAREKRSYEAARNALRGEGCKAGGYRLAAVDGGDYPLCCRHLAYSWRMFTAYFEDTKIVIVALDLHSRDHNPAAYLAEILPGLSPTGRRRSAKPTCCEESSTPPLMDDQLHTLLIPNG